MTDMMDALDMTTAELADDEGCINCNDDFAPKHVEGWGNLCPDCYEGMMDYEKDRNNPYY